MRNLIENDEVIKQIKPYLKDVEAYIVGGFVRDILMNTAEWEALPDYEFLYD